MRPEGAGFRTMPYTKKNRSGGVIYGTPAGQKVQIFFEELPSS